jgi:hypothetical protein
VVLAPMIVRMDSPLANGAQVCRLVVQLFVGPAPPKP